MTETSKVKKITENSWLIEVEEDQQTKELFIELPVESLNQLGWHEDDILLWQLDDNGVGVTITKKEEN